MGRASTTTCAAQSRSWGVGAQARPDDAGHPRIPLTSLREAVVAEQGVCFSFRLQPVINLALLCGTR